MTDVAAAMPPVRSMLFMPGGRADMVGKIPRYAPDIAVVDLEDAVAAGDKASARATAVEAVNRLDAGRTTVLVRVNPPGTAEFADDLAAVVGTTAHGVVVPKLGTVAQLSQVHDALARVSPLVVVGGIETGLGVADVRSLVSAGLSAVYFGAEDYVADVGGRRTARGDEVLYARSRVALAAQLAGIPAVDQAVVDFRDDDRFEQDAAAGASLGYRGKICIHPRQVELAHTAFTPTANEVEHARAVLSAADRGVGVVDGQMVDEVHVRMARDVLARAEG